MRKGIIAGVNEINKTILLDCPVFYGNSGGPVIQIDIESNTTLPGLTYNYHIIGIVTQFIPYEESWENRNNHLINKEWFNSGYSVAVSIDKVFELIGNS